MVEAVAKKYHIDLDAPVNTLKEEQVKVILYGTQGEAIDIKMEGRNERQTSFQAAFEGVIPNLERATAKPTQSIFATRSLSS